MSVAKRFISSPTERAIASAEGDQRRARLWQNLALLKAQLRPEAAIESAILPVIIGDENAAMAMSTRLRDQGFLIPAIRYPTVARGTARLRITLSAAHEEAQVQQLLAALGRAL